MYAAWTLQIKAQVCPNSATVPKRFAGIPAMACAARVDSGFPVCFDAAAKPLRFAAQNPFRQHGDDVEQGYGHRRET